MKCDMQEKRITYHNSCGSTDAHRHMATMLSALEDIFKYEKTQYVTIEAVRAFVALIGGTDVNLCECTGYIWYLDDRCARRGGAVDHPHM
jgi:hypothetical protein